MSNSTQTETRPEKGKPTENVIPAKRIVMMPGSRGGSGKTTVAVAINEFYNFMGLQVQRLDYDVENKVASSFKHFYPDATKYDFHKREEIDNLILSIEHHVASVIFADFGAGAQADTVGWFEEMHSPLKRRKVAFTFVGVLDGDIGSLKGILEWGENTARYDIQWLIVLNENGNPGEKFTYWELAEEAIKFRERFKPAIVRLKSRNPDFQNLLRNYGAKMSDVISEAFPKGHALNQFNYILRAEGLQKHFNDQLERVYRSHLLPPD